MQNVPDEVQAVLRNLEQAGYEAFVVGGCVRDLLLGRPPKDWDVATNAVPEEIQRIFPRSFYENRFFTVTVLTGSADPSVAEVEVTTYRSDKGYADRRRPEEVSVAETLQEDLARRDFTVNAVALSPGVPPRIIDPFGGRKDLERKLIRAVGNPADRFQEDALRMMRAVRLASVLGFSLEEKTREGIRKAVPLLKDISQERIRDEFLQIVMSDASVSGLENLRELGLLPSIMPELLEGVGVGQNKHHIYSVWEHNLRALEYAARKGWSMEVRLAALLHDVAKPRTKRGEGPDSTFYGHQVVGARMARKILERLRLPRAAVEDVALLIREHMFVYDPEAVTLKGVRRLLARTGEEHIDDLFRLREADRIGSGVPKAQPYRLRHLRAMVEKVRQDPVSPKMLKIGGSEIMQILGIDPGPRVGFILAVLLEEVLEDPSRNEESRLQERVRELGGHSGEELERLARQAKQSAKDAQERIDEAIKEKHFVK